MGIAAIPIEPSIRFKSIARRINLDKKVKLSHKIWVIHYDMLRTRSGLASACFADPAVSELVNEVFCIGIVMQ